MKIVGVYHRHLFIVKKIYYLGIDTIHIVSRYTFLPETSAYIVFRYIFFYQKQVPVAYTINGRS